MPQLILLLGTICIGYSYIIVGQVFGFAKLIGPYMPEIIQHL